MTDITYYGHSTFLVTLDNTKILFDPFISPNELAEGIDIQAINADYILITHGHGDHVADVEVIAKNNNATVVANFEVATWFQEKGVEKVHPMNHGGSKTFDFGKVKYVHAIHSSTLPDGTPGGNPGGFVVQSKDTTFYYAGDTGLIPEMEWIPRHYGRIDLAVLPVGGNFTMDYEEAALAAGYIGCRQIIGVHFDTFPPIEIDKAAARSHFAAKNLELTLPEIGQTLSFDAQPRY